MRAPNPLRGALSTSAVPPDLGHPAVLEDQHTVGQRQHVEQVVGDQHRRAAVACEHPAQHRADRRPRPPRRARPAARRAAARRVQAASARAIATRWACPPDSSRGCGRPTRPAPTSSQPAQRGRSRGAARPGAGLRGANATLSATLRCGNSSGSCSSRPTRRSWVGDVHARRRCRSARGRRTGPGPLSGRTQSGDHVQRGGLAGAVGPEQRHHLAGGARSNSTSTSRAATDARTYRPLTGAARPGTTEPAGAEAEDHHAPRPRPAGSTAPPRRRRRFPAAGRSPAAASG